MAIQLLNGLTYGALLLSTAVGLALMFGLRGVVNFAHGALYALGAYLGYSIAQQSNYWIALVLAPLVAAGIGAALDRFILRPLDGRPRITLVLLTFGLGLVLTDAFRWIWGSDQLLLNPPAALAGTVGLAGSTYPVYRLFIAATGLLTGLALILLLRRTSFGLRIRTASAAPDIAAIHGVNVSAVQTLVVALAVGLAGLAGVLAAPLFTVTPDMGATVLVESFIVIVVGGLASMPGAMVAALVIGMVTTSANAYLGSYATLAPYIVVAMILIIRPHGLAGERA
ncbi:branched-chain amino acid ABC transporter permease [Nocardioides sp.]|uniref:branched-chain amino acid ABC transporter permease n=1 Tax=Nocardioides sp. TaxID=35761 RepID=UPI002634EF0F|nr:branched-chain amino acid ABC transporter permease [Nocardioides sp.]MDI6912495.1 branched-chain amino acid ABC transporter permease [Nocardioides sp.]